MARGIKTCLLIFKWFGAEGTFILYGLKSTATSCTLILHLTISIDTIVEAEENIEVQDECTSIVEAVLR